MSLFQEEMASLVARNSPGHHCEVNFGEAAVSGLDPTHPVGGVFNELWHGK